MQRTFKLFFSIFFFVFCAASTQNYKHADKLINLNYRDAFNQNKIHTKFKNLLEGLGCAHNVFSDYEATFATDLINPLELRAYQDACIKKLTTARRWAITESARENLTLVMLLFGATLTTVKLAGKEGGTFSVFAGLFNSVYLLHEVVSSGYDLLFQPSHPLNELEQCFAKNQCYIPQELWPIIINAFMTARQNKVDQGKALSFLEFTLGLNLFKPLPKFQRHGINVSNIINSLHERIDNFFRDYNEVNLNDLKLIKVNCAKYILSLFDRTQLRPRYIILQGPGGIGKTHFMQKLSSWIMELVPESTHYEDVVISSPQELEGNSTHPGILLQILRNQIANNKEGSIVFMDEALWINDKQMRGSIKRVFNGNFTKISTAYFGTNIKGTTVALDAPPMLICLASNNAAIEDPATAGRFDIIKFPYPSQATLVNYAYQLAKQSKLLRLSNIEIDKAAIETWIQENDIKEFRQIQANIEQNLLTV